MSSFTTLDSLLRGSERGGPGITGFVNASSRDLTDSQRFVEYAVFNTTPLSPVTSAAVVNAVYVLCGLRTTTRVGGIRGEEDEGAASQESDGDSGPPERKAPNVRRDCSLRGAGRKLDLASAIALAAGYGAILN